MVSYIATEHLLRNSLEGNGRAMDALRTMGTFPGDAGKECC